MRFFMLRCIHLGVITSCRPFLLHLTRAEEEAAARAKLEKEKRDLLSQLHETQDDLDAEREGRQRAEKQRKQLNEVNGCHSQLVSEL